MLKAMQKNEVIVTEHRVSEHDCLVVVPGSLYHLPQEIRALAESRGAIFEEQAVVEQAQIPVLEKKKGR